MQRFDRAGSGISDPTYPAFAPTQGRSAEYSSRNRPVLILVGDFLETAGPRGAALGITLGGLAMLVITQSYVLMVRTFPVAGAEFAYAYRALPMPHISDFSASIGATCWPISCRV